MRRREFIRLLGSGVMAWPLAARAQQPAMPVIGFLNGASASGYAKQTAAFLQGLQEAGYRVGQNVSIEYRWADGQYDRLPALAAELLHRQVAVIVANGPAFPTLKTATTTVPIVFSIASDPIESGLVTSLNRPGGNITGVTNLNVQLAAKRLELMHELVPTAVNISVLVNPNNVKTAQAFARDAQAAAETLGLKLDILNASNERELNTVIETLAKHQTGGLIIATDTFFNDQIARLAALTKERAIPAVFQFREFAAAGGLMSYGGSLPDSWRLAGVYAGRILKGEKPADLPVQQSTKAELIINLKTAKAFGLTVPLPLLARADEVIE